MAAKSLLHQLLSQQWQRQLHRTHPRSLRSVVAAGVDEAGEPLLEVVVVEAVAQTKTLPPTIQIKTTLSVNNHQETNLTKKVQRLHQMFPTTRVLVTGVKAVMLHTVVTP